ncbi:MAG: hypothetical protein AABW48_04350 [Nanoarchaeota archaeon]
MFKKNKGFILVLISLLTFLILFSAANAADADVVATDAGAVVTDADAPLLDTSAGATENKELAVSSAANLSPAITSCIYYFYAKECPNCVPLDSYFIGLTLKYPKLQVEKFEVYHNYQNYKLVQDYFNAYNIKEKNIPVVFISGSYFIGTDSITSFLEESIKKNPNASCPLPEEKPIGVIGKGEPLDVLKRLTFLSVTTAALTDLFTPGMIALLLILLAIVTLIEELEHMLKKGTLFIMGVYLAYCLFGVGLFSWLNNHSLYLYFYKFIGFAAILFAVVGINMFFKTWHSVIKKYPDYQESVKSAATFVLSYPGVFLVGFISALFTFAGVNNTFILLRDVYTGYSVKSAILPLIFYYGLILLLLFVVLLIAFHFIRQQMEEYATRNKVSDVKETMWKKHYVQILNFCIRTFMLVLGLVLLFI